MVAKEYRSIEFERLCEIMDTLREKCPWDKKQTLKSLSHLTIEEIYELYDAIAEENSDHISEEIGDIMLHLVFYIKILNEKNGTTVNDVLKKLNDKLIFRHPHVYENQKDLTEEAVKKNWEQLKLKEGRKSILQGVPNALPAIIKAYRMQEKAAQVGFDWPNYQDVYDKFQEEIHELNEAIDLQNKDEIENEFGDVLFSLINMARHLKIDPEMALQKTNNKFKKRFEFIEDNAEKPLNEMSLNEMDILWNQAKTI